MPKRSVLIFVLAAAAAVGAATYWVTSGDETPASTKNSNAGIEAQSTNTVAYKWQWGNFTDTRSSSKPGESPKKTQPHQSAKAPYDVVEVYKILQGINLDDNGRLVPDQKALLALERGFNDLGANLSPETLAGLQDVIRKGLPGQAGEQAAQILENYYRYRLAEIEFDRQQEGESPATDELKGGDPQKQAKLPTVDRYEELVRLRRSFLGAEVADKLFAVEDTNARHMFASLAIQQDPGLTPAQKQVQQEALEAKLNDRLLALGQLKRDEAAAEKVRRLREQGAPSAEIFATRVALVGTDGARKLTADDREEAQWQARFNGFWQARRYVMRAGLDEAERDRQVEQLLEQYFSPEERQRARDTSSDWQAREAK